MKKKIAKKQSKGKINKKILKVARDMLLEKREELVSKVHKKITDGKEYNKQEVRDVADLASDSYENEFLYSLSDTERKYLEEVENALKRAEEGTYGKCNLCGKLIHFERLKSLPFAMFCIKCQKKNEKPGLRR